MARRHLDWLHQAQRDFKAAGDSLAAQNYEWTAFQAQQAAEKALKALLRFHNFDATGHTLIHLLEQARRFIAVPDELPPLARDLDRHYKLSRSPRLFDSGFPGEFYDKETAERCLEDSKRISDWAGSKTSAAAN